MAQYPGSRGVVRLVGFAAVLAGAMGSARGDVLVLADGRTIVGLVEEGGAIVRVHAGGIVLEFARTQVADVRMGIGEEELFAEAASAKGASDPDSWFETGRHFEKVGLPRLAHRAFAKAIDIDPDHASTREARGEIQDSGAWVPFEEYIARRGLVRADPESRIEAEGPPETPPEEARRPPADPVDRIRARGLELAELRMRYLAAKIPEARAELRVMREELSAELARDLLASDEPAIRGEAARALGHSREFLALDPLVRSCLADRSDDVRALSLGALQAIGYSRTPYLIEPALYHQHPAIRANALAAIGAFGNFPALHALVRTIHVRHGGGPRANIFVGREIAYIKDFDVQAAQNATIADPVVGVVREGVVLDAKVLWIDEYFTVEERQGVFGHIRRIAGADLSDDPDAWIAWWHQNAPALEAKYLSNG